MNESIINGEQKSVLIVEDEKIIASNLKVIVENLGYRISGIVSSGKSALDLIEKTGDKTSLILMDINLKGELDGIETASKISSRHNIALIYVTGNSDEYTVQKAMRQTSPYAIINKPFNPCLLESTIQGALDNAPSNDRESGDSQVIKALPSPWEKASLIVEGTEEPVVLIELSMSGVKILTDVPLYSHMKYRITLSLPRPWGKIRGFTQVMSHSGEGQFVTYWLRHVLHAHDKFAWEEYIRHRLDTGAH